MEGGITDHVWNLEELLGATYIGISVG